MGSVDREVDARDHSADSEDRQEAVRRIADPRVVAIVGASPNADSYGGRLLSAALRGEPRVTVYPVNPNYETIDGRKSYPTVSSLPEVPDVVGVVVRHDRVPGALRDSAQAGVRAAVVVSAGFAERGEGDASQKDIARLAQQDRIRVCGPNCLGAANLVDDIWLCAGTLRSDLPSASDRGNVGLICQSGALGFVTLVPRAQEFGVTWSHVFTTGNEADLEFSDFARYLAEDPSTDVIAGFVEGFKDIPAFVSACRLAAARGKPIVMVKIGRAPEGTSAARSHTAAMTGADEVSQALFKQHGVVRVDDYDELLDVAGLLAVWKPTDTTMGVGVMSNSGGVGSLTADLLGTAGLTLPPLTDSARDRISEILGGFGWAANPADITQVAWREEFQLVLQELLSESEIGVVVVASSPSLLQVDLLCAEAARFSKQVIYLWTGAQPGPEDHERQEALRRLRQARIPVFFSPARLAAALKAAKEYYEWVERQTPPAAHAGAEALAPEWGAELRQMHPNGRQNLSEWESAQLLESAGIRFSAARLSSDEDEAVRNAELLGYPVVLKAGSADVAHKTDLGLVQLDLESPDGVREAFRTIRRHARSYSADLGECQVLVQKFVPSGIEVVIGVYHDAQAGPIIVCGAGGMYVELFDDVSRRLCPVTRSSASEMLDELRIAPLFRGFRGGPPVDRQGLVDLLVRVSQLAIASDGVISEVELNPVIVSAGQEAVVAVDALVTLASHAGR
jgi:acyl-CoA synthetase (NDP forming)